MNTSIGAKWLIAGLIVFATICVAAIVVLIVFVVIGWTRQCVTRTGNIVINEVTSISQVGVVGIKFAVLNKTQGLTSDEEVISVMNAVQKQVIRDFEPYWDLTAELFFFREDQEENIPSDYWKMIVAPNSDIADALGYHTVDGQGKPIGFAFVNTAEQADIPWSITFSHEVLEMIGDPYANLVVFIQNSNTTGMLFAYENCDPVQSYDQSYEIDGIRVSNFVTPSWFGTYNGKAPYDFRENLATPLTITPGGYQLLYEVDGGSGWQIVTAMYTSELNQKDINKVLVPEDRNILRPQNVLASHVDGEIKNAHKGCCLMRTKDLDYLLKNYYKQVPVCDRTIKVFRDGRAKAKQRPIDKQFTIARTIINN